jgi:hypothetical protein
MLSYCPFRAYSLLTCLVFTTVSNAALAQIAGLSRLGGWVYIDRNNDGILAFSTDPNPEYVIGDIQIDLFSKAGSVETLVATTHSDDFGRYLFEDINPGAYVLRESQSVMYVDGLDTLGILQSLNGQPIPGNASTGAMTNDAFVDIVLTADVGGEFYNFGERGLAVGYVSKRFLFASYSGPPTTPPPPETPPPPPETPLFPEPASLAMALMAVFGIWSILGRNRRK